MNYKNENSLSAAERDVFRQLFFHGPTWDGDVTSKTGRDGLLEKGLAVRYDGWQMLTEIAFRMAVSAGMGDAKEAWQNIRRRAS